jgi:predicted tellurium resistance membrane protein TerC
MTPGVEYSLSGAIMAVALSDISLAFDNALANSQMAAGLPRQQQKKALIFGMLLSCATMIVLTFVVVQLRSKFDWIRYPAGIWLLYVVFKLWFDKEKEHAPHQLARAMMKAILLIAFTDLTMAADNAIANSEFALGGPPQHLWTILIFGLMISCVFMISCTYAIVWIRQFADWIKYPAGLWLLYVAFLILKPGWKIIQGVFGS